MSQDENRISDLIDGGLIKKKESLCDCGNHVFTHRHSNWIECTKCNKIKILDQ